VSIRWNSAVAVAILALLAGGCATDVPQRASKQAKVAKPVDPNDRDTLPVVAQLPPGSFDQARSQSELAAAQAARSSGDLALARGLAESAVADWPGSLDAWAELQADAEAQHDLQGAHYALFFHDKVDAVTPLPPRAASLGFLNIAEGNEDGKKTYDDRTLAMGARMAAFYAMRDSDAPASTKTAQTASKGYLDDHPPISMVLFGALVAGVLTGAKEIK